MSYRFRVIIEHTRGLEYSVDMFLSNHIQGMQVFLTTVHRTAILVDNCFETNGVVFSTKKCALYLKIQYSVRFFLNASPSKRVVCFTLNNLHYPLVEGIIFYALYKSKVLIILCKADGFYFYLWDYQMKFKNSRLVSLSNLEFNFFFVLCSNLKETLHY